MGAVNWHHSMFVVWDLSSLAVSALYDQVLYEPDSARRYHRISSDNEVLSSVALRLYDKTTTVGRCFLLVDTIAWNT